MKKTKLITIISLFALAANGQDIRQYIPFTTNIVGEINPKHINNKGGENNLKSHFLSKFFLTTLAHNFEEDEDTFNMENIGINSNKSSYHFYTVTDSIDYQVHLFSLNNAELLRSKLNELETENGIKTNDSYSTINIGDGNYYIFNDQTLMIINANLSTYYYYNNKNNPYGLKNINFYDYYKVGTSYDNDEYTTVEAVEVVSAKSDDGNDVEDYNEAADEIYTADAVKVVEDENDATKLVEPPLSGIYNHNTQYSAQEGEAEKKYDSAYEAQQIIVDSLTEAFVLNYAEQLWHNKQSILEDKNFIKSNKSTAYANVFAKNINNLYPADRIFGLGIDKLNKTEPIDYYAANLMLNEKDVQLNYEIKFSKEQAKKYKQVEKRKVNKKLLKYLNYDTDIAVVSYAFNTENYLNFTYDQLKQLALAPYNNETNLIADIMQLLLDEKEIGKAYRGDGIFVVTGINNHKYTYTTYDYDDDFNYKTITKEKNEKLPDFLYAYSTQNSLIHRKILNYIDKYDYIKSKDGIYSISDKYINNIPYNLHILVKNDIVFMGTHLADVQKIALNKYPNNNKCSTNKNIRKNSFYGYLRPELLSDKFITDNVETNIKINNFINSLGKFEWKQPKMKCRKSKGSITAEIGGNNTNSLDYILNTIDDIFRLY